MITKEKHFHVCENCYYVWGHSSQEADASKKEPHFCPQCNCGPYRQAYSEAYALKIAAAFIFSDFMQELFDKVRG